MKEGSFFFLMARRLPPAVTPLTLGWHKIHMHTWAFVSCYSWARRLRSMQNTRPPIYPIRSDVHINSTFFWPYILSRTREYRTSSADFFYTIFFCKLMRGISVTPSVRTHDKHSWMRVLLDSGYCTLFFIKNELAKNMRANKILGSQIYDAISILYETGGWHWSK